MTWFKKHAFESILVIMAAVFFIVYQFLYWGLYHEQMPGVQYAGTLEPAMLIFNQPDEMANYLFIREWVLHGRLGLAEPLSKIADNQVHPRSMTVVNGELVPIGFPGFIVIVGMLLKALHFLDGGKLFNYAVVMVTPLAGAVAPLFLYGIIRRLSGNRTLAFISAVGLFVLPAWWYYASRPLQHMTLLVTLLLVATYYFIENKNRLHIWTLFLFMFGWGLALYIRPTEWLWTLFLFGSLWVAVKPKLTAKTVLSGVVGATVIGALFFATQSAFYGHPLASGYVRPQESGAGGMLTTGPQGIPLVKAIFLPFGFDPVTIAKTLFNYLIKLVQPWFVAAAFGFIFIWLYGEKKLKHYSLIAVGTGVLVLLYYGSWNFADNLAGVASIGSSQARYFLPAYILSLPFVAFLIKKLWTMTLAGKITALLVPVVLILSSVKIVYLKFEGLVYVKNTVAQYYDWQAQVYAKTPQSAVIATRYADKYIFPGRRVVVNWQGGEEIKALVSLSKLGFPLFWYDVQLSETDKLKVVRVWAESGLVLGEPVAVWENLELRPIIFKK